MRARLLLLGQVEVPTNDRGPLRRFLERVRAEPLHRTVEVLDADVEQRRIRVIDVSVDGPICHDSADDHVMVAGRALGD